MVNKIGYSIVEQLTKNRFFITHPLLEILKNTFQSIHSILKLIQYIIGLVSLMKNSSKIIF